MGDPAALQEAIQRAKQLAAKITQSAPVKRPLPSSTIEHSGPVKVTLAYEKPANNNNSDDTNKSDHHRSSSRDYSHRNERDFRDHKSTDRDNNHNQRESSASNRSGSDRSGYSSQNQPDSGMSQSSHPPLLPQTQQSSMLPSNTRPSGEEKIELIIPHAVIGLVIGKGGENIKRIQNETGAAVRVDPNTIDEKGNKSCTITGTRQAIDEAHAQVVSVIESATQNKRPRTQMDASDVSKMKIPAHRTGAIIGKGGETIKAIKQQSGCEIELDKNSKECGPDESLFIIRGSQDKIQKARSLIEQRLARGARDGPNDGGRDRDRHHHHTNDNHGSRSGSSRGGGSGGVATGANAAPVAQFTDLPTPYAAQANQQNSAEVTAAWAAYMAQAAQYSSMYSQAGSQPGMQPGMAYGAAGQPGLLGSTTGAVHPSASSASAMLPNMSGAGISASSGQHQSGAPQVPGGDGGPPGQSNQSQDYTDQWIEFYLANGRPDYAEQMMQLKKQQQAQNSQAQQS